MGSRLSGASRLIAAAAFAGAVLLVLSSPALAQEDGSEAQELYDSGLELYRNKDYPAAITALSRSYKLDPRPETLFAWAQAERLSGSCARAIPLYREFLEKNAKLKQSQLVRENLDLCEKELAVDDASPPARDGAAGQTTPPLAPSGSNADRPGKTPVVQLGLIIVGAAGLGASTGLFIASRASRDGASAAESIEDYQRLNDRADTQQTLGIVAGAGSAALIVGGIVWALLADDPEPSAVSLVPARGGGVMVNIDLPLR